MYGVYVIYCVFNFWNIRFCSFRSKVVDKKIVDESEKCVD